MEISPQLRLGKEFTTREMIEEIIKDIKFASIKLENISKKISV